MKRIGRSLALVALAALVLAGPIFGQNLLPKRIWNLTIIVNVPNAIIFVDNVQLQGNVAKVTGGPHNVRVHADGYADFNGAVNVSNNMTFTVNLNSVAVLAPLMIRVPTPGARIFVDNVDVTGQVPSVALGMHSIRVSAPGFQDYNSAVNVTSPLTMDVALQPAGVLLTVNANVANATVTVNNVVKGPTPYSDYYAPAMYNVTVSADGYADYVANISLSQAMTLNVQLKPLQPATLTFIIPPAFRDTDMRQGDPQGQVKIWVDNRLVNTHQETDRIAVSPGRHNIRVASGSFAMQVPDFIAQPGVNYTIDFTITVNVRPSN